MWVETFLGKKKKLLLVVELRGYDISPKIVEQPWPMPQWADRVPLPVCACVCVGLYLIRDRISPCPPWRKSLAGVLSTITAARQENQCRCLIHTLLTAALFTLVHTHRPWKLVTLQMISINLKQPKQRHLRKFCEVEALIFKWGLKISGRPTSLLEI